jgi:WXG100 family type VII secretion target
MSNDIIRMDYDLMREMSSVFRQGGEQLQDTMSEMQSIANQMEGGALVGQGGDAFLDALRGKLSPAIQRLVDKFEELDHDVLVAMQEMQDSDAESAGKF